MKVIANIQPSHFLSPESKENMKKEFPPSVEVKKLVFSDNRLKMIFPIQGSYIRVNSDMYIEIEFVP